MRPSRTQSTSSLLSVPTKRRRLQKFSKSFEEYAAYPATVSNLTISQFTFTYKEDKEEVFTENKQKHAERNE
eukprot:6030121-Ditylum_brightwellii.AAC.1